MNMRRDVLRGASALLAGSLSKTANARSAAGTSLHDEHFEKH